MNSKQFYRTQPNWKKSQISVFIPKGYNLNTKADSKPKNSLDLQLEPGEKLILQPVSWQRLTQILAELDLHRSFRVAYADKVLEIIAPLLDEDRTKVIIANLVEILLKFQDKSWESFGSTTLKSESRGVAIEPDNCFYIHNYQAVVGKNKLNLTQQPPPDLVIDTDGVSINKVAAYETLRVPELWIYTDGKLKIHILVNSEYMEFNTSPNFPDIPVAKVIPQFVERANIFGVTKALEEFDSYLQKLK